MYFRGNIIILIQKELDGIYEDFVWFAGGICILFHISNQSSIYRLLMKPGIHDVRRSRLSSVGDVGALLKQISEF